jgi:lipopolysaccharide export system protein LptA
MRFGALKTGIAASAMLLIAQGAVSQGASLSFGEMSIDPDSPIELSADELSVSQPDGAATFSGSVMVAQGDLRIAADTMRIEYAQGEDGGRNRISRLFASGGVTVVTPSEAAEAQEAVYSIADGTVVLTGDVILTQGPNAISGDVLTIDLAGGTGRFEGRVRTVLQGGSN